jgi:hypothetical protein
MSWSDTCAAASAPKSDAIRTSGAIWSRCDRTRSAPAIRPRRGGRANDDLTDLSTSPKQVYLPGACFWIAFSFQNELGSAMLDSEFKRQRTQVLRELVEQTNDPFIKRRLLALMTRYDDGVTARIPLTPTDLQFRSQGTGSEQ